MTDPHHPPAADSTPAAEVYSQRNNPAFEAQMAARRAAQAAAFFLPFLRPGMRLLDVGCGPGTITQGLAEAVAPGSVIGIDFQPAQVEQARALAVERRVANLRFVVGDGYRLSFPAQSFDAVFAHAVLMHLREPVRALAEMRRVLRPGGIVGVRDPDFGAGFVSPAMPLDEQWGTWVRRVRQHNGVNPTVGRHHRRFLLEAGFVRAEASATVESAGSLEETRLGAGFSKDMLRGLARTGIAQGWVDQSMVDAMVAELDAWAERPDAFSATIWCAAVGWLGD